MGRADRNQYGPGRGARRHGGAPHGVPSPQQLTDEAETLQQQGERRKGKDAAAKYLAAASKYQDALSAAVQQRQGLGVPLGPPDVCDGSGRGAHSNLMSLQDAVDARSNLAECHQLLADALLEAAAARPDGELSWEVERQAAAAAVRHLITAVGHYACCRPESVLVSPPAGGDAAAAATGGGGGDAGAVVAGAAAADAASAAALAAAPSLSPDVAVNAGNCLASLAEQLEEEAGRLVAGAAAEPAAWLALYGTALRCYRAAAGCYRSAVVREEDALTLGNLGDVLVQTGTCLYGVARAVRDAPAAPMAAALGGVQGAAGGADGTGGAPPLPAEWAAACESEAAGEFAAALSSYEAACSLSDSSQGDDLPGLLCNWGAGLLSMAGCLQDPAARLPLLEQAAGRLTHAASFDRADPAPLCNLGDVLAAAGEAAEALAAAAAAAHAMTGFVPTTAAAATTTGGTATPDAVHWYGVAAGHLQAALDRGYRAALRLRQDEPEALVGCGEVHLALARISLRAPVAAAAAASASTGTAAGTTTTDGGDGGWARAHAQAAVGALQAAVSRPERLGGWRQRCDVRYNLACALALAGREHDAHQLFSALLVCGGVRAAELAADVDLAPVRQAPWFQDLLQQQYQHQQPAQQL